MSSEVVLRPVCEADLETLFAHQDDEVVREMGVVPYRPRTEFFAKWRDVLGDDQVVKRSVWFEDALVGYFICFLRDGVREVGYIIARTHWGKGIASAALSQFLPLISHLPRPLTARVVKHNYASLRVLQKSGFLIEGEMVVRDEEGRNIPEFQLSLAEDPRP